MANPTPKGAKREKVRSFALGLPDAYEDFPWGEVVVKVNGKVFVFLGGEPQLSHGMSVKLRASHDQALDSPGAAPTGYGLGRAGWVSIPLSAGSPPIGVLRDWVEESYRIVAPKRTVARLDKGRAATLQPSHRPRPEASRHQPRSRTGPTRARTP